LTARREPNVYWIVLDGYPRRDVLQEFFDFDNGAFVERLKGLNFSVYDRAVASFPETAFSISSTLAMGFLPLRPGFRHWRNCNERFAARMSSSIRSARWATVTFTSRTDMTI
jgi:hypothetical protein